MATLDLLPAALEPLRVYLKRASELQRASNLAAFAVRNIEPTELAAKPPEWPADPSEIPGEMIGSYTSGRAATDVGSWQSNRQIIANLKSAAKGGAKRGWLG